MKRREFFKKAAVTAGAAALGTTAAEAGVTHQPIDNRKVSNVAFPEKRPLITYSDRPPLLETPREVFTSALTPNDQFLCVGTCRISRPILIRRSSPSASTVWSKKSLKSP